MSAQALAHTRASLASLADHLDVPDGFRVEIVGGALVVSPTPRFRHALIVSRLQAQLRPVENDGRFVAQYVTLDLAATGERYVPDLVVLPTDAAGDDEWLVPADLAALVVEVTSPGNADTDRVRKLRGYARAKVAAYLLVDVDEQTVTLFSEPEDATYRAHTQVPFGTPLRLLPPLDVALQTSELG